MEYLVVYSSRTGNTEKLAMEIFVALPGKSKDVQKVEEYRGEAETYFVGFWNHKGICSEDILNFLEGLHGKRVALFGTCGMGQDRQYWRTTGIWGHFCVQGRCRIRRWRGSVPWRGSRAGSGSGR